MVNSTSPQRRRLSPAQWQALFERFEAGNENVTAFCRRHGVSKSSFHRWRRKLAEPPPSTPPIEAEIDEPAFIEVGSLADGQAGPVAAAWDVELALGDGIVLRLRRG